MVEKRGKNGVGRVCYSLEGTSDSCVRCEFVDYYEFEIYSVLHLQIEYFTLAPSLPLPIETLLPGIKMPGPMIQPYPGREITQKDVHFNLMMVACRLLYHIWLAIFSLGNRTCTQSFPRVHADYDRWPRCDLYGRSAMAVKSILWCSVLCISISIWCSVLCILISISRIERMINDW